MDFNGTVKILFAKFESFLTRESLIRIDFE